MNHVHEMIQRLGNFKLAAGSHVSPDGLGNVCINEAAIVAAGFPYREVKSVYDMPPCFSQVISQYAFTLNDRMPDEPRQMLLGYVLRLAGTADTAAAERQRAAVLVRHAVNVFAANALDRIGLTTRAKKLRLAEAPHVAYALLKEAEEPVRDYAAAYSVVLAARKALESEKLPPYQAFASAQAAASSARGAPGTEAATIEWGNALKALDAALAIGKQAEPIEVGLVSQRMAWARNGARGVRVAETESAPA